MKLDLDHWKAIADDLFASADQVPFALSQAMNTAAFETRTYLIEMTWPAHVEVRNPNFIRQLNVDRANKGGLTVVIHDRRTKGRAHLSLHDTGGTKGAEGRLAIPPSGSEADAARGAKGVPRNLRPKAIIAATPSRALRITPQGIFIGRGGRLHMAYNFQPNAQQPADVPFGEDFVQVMGEAMERLFPAAIGNAMRSRRSKRSNGSWRG
jgi:hypothetical protein